MTLGLAKSYTPSSGQTANSTSYNTDISALFNAFSGLEAQTSTLGGLTITPSANSTTKFLVNNAAGTELFSLDTTNSYMKLKATGRFYLDGGGNTYMVESSADVIDIYAGGVNTVRITNEALTLAQAPAGVPAANSLYKDNIVKGWINFNGTGTISTNDSFNVSGITDNGTGDYTVTWDRDFANINYLAIPGVSNQGGTGAMIARVKDGGVAVGSVRIETFTIAGAANDPGNVYVMAIGDQ